VSPFPVLRRIRAERRATAETRAAVAAYVSAVRATLPAFDSVTDATLVTVGGALLTAAATGPGLSRLSDVLAMGSEFVDTADLSGLLAIAHEHLEPLVFDAT
jgi:hypothetical protein